jgi:hypothetical protein
MKKFLDMNETDFAEFKRFVIINAIFMLVLVIINVVYSDDLVLVYRKIYDLILAGSPW